MLGGGSSLVGGTLKTEITARGSLELALDGFLPVVRADAISRRKKPPVRIAKLGLPLGFRSRGHAASGGVSRSAGDAQPDAILFNGGFFIPEMLRQRVADVLEHWYGQPPAIFENRDLDLAVARRRGVLLLRALDRRRAAGSRRFAARLLHRASDRRRFAASDVPVPRGTEEGSRSSSTPAICNWSRTGPWRSGCTVR